MAFCRQVGLLLWKNWLLQRRKICVSIFEVLLPVAFAVIILVIRTLVKPKDVNYPHYYNTQPIDDRYEFMNSAVVGYTPASQETTLVMNYVTEMYNDHPNGHNFSAMPFDTEEMALHYFSFHSSEMRHIIVFEGVDNTSNSLPQHLNFKIRPYTGSDTWRTAYTYPFFQENGPRFPSYLYSERVLFIQSLVSEGIAKYWLNKTGQNPDQANFEVYKKQLAFPPYFDDPLITVIQNQLPLFIVLSFILSVIINTKNLVYEKERKLKESMKLMGLTATAHWMSWFLTFFIYLVISIAIYSLLLGIHIVAEGPVLANSDPSLFFVYLLCYSLALITFSFMVSTFVQKANVAAALAGILFFAFFFPYYFVQPNYETLSKSAKMASALLFNDAMALGANCIGIAEGTGEGSLWTNFHKPATVDDNLSLLECMIMLLVDTVIHLIITWYLDNVRPGEFGVPKPFYFCFTKSYWCGARKEIEGTYETSAGQNKHFEKEPTGLQAGVKICNLKKTFGQKVAVAGTSLNMYEGQITVLLGHNGAGKTTTMSMLTGFIPPTSGTAMVNGYDITTNLPGVRSSLGLCPQHNILFDSLTVEEHLTFFAKLKGCSGKKIEEEVFAMAKEVGLELKFKARSENLSGGQKRKLSVGIALIGGSKVVILDEPTSGMDPAARRQTWNVLQNARQGRTLVLSTHYMDEADLLGDRIAIMAEGVVKCCGSSMFLKKLYGAGYHLVVVKNKECNVNKLTQFVSSHVNSAELDTIINSEVSYLLPSNESGKFADLFRAMDDQKVELDISSFGTTATTMEEVFLKVGESAVDEEDNTKSVNSNGEVSRNGFHGNAYINPSFNHEKTHLHDSESSSICGPFGSNNKVDVVKENLENDFIFKANNKKDIMAFNKGYQKRTGFGLRMSRIHALFVKKALHTWRNRSVTLAQLLLPVIFTIIGLAIEEARPKQTKEPALTLDLGPFGRTYIPYSEGLNPTSQDKDFAKVYKEQFGTGHTLEIVSMIKENFDNYTMRRAIELGTSTFSKKMIIGMEMNQPSGNKSLSGTAYFNSQPLHSEPISLNYLMNALLQKVTNNSFSLQTILDPLPKDETEAAEFNMIMALSSGFSIGFFISFGMAFLTTLFIFFLIKERQVGAKHMQVVSGVGPVTYWLPTFLWDFINYIVPSLLLLIVFLAYQKGAYLHDGRWALVILMLIIYGWAVLPFMYAFQFAFSSPPTGVVTVIMLNIVTGLVTTLVVFVLQFPGLDTEDVAEALNWVFMILFPNYNLASCFINIQTNHESLKFCEIYQPQCLLTNLDIPCCKNTCNKLCFPFETSYVAWDKPGIGANLFFMALQGIVFFIVVILIEYHVFQRIWYLIRGSPYASGELMSYEAHAANIEDSDVAAERQRVNSTPASVLSASDPLLLVNLYKRYGNFVSVDHICVGVPEQECFGLLGQNGAGKTTTFKMLTGDVMVTGGNAYLKGFDVRSDIKNVQANMGYCPQFDALIDQMTGRETLTMYARLRGVPENSIEMVTNTLMEILMLTPHADKLAGQYSGGNKRKLSTAMALVGDPPFIMLDEPSCGMDPKARRQLWNVLSEVRAAGRTLVLTSHSMEECDALCTRIAIMVNGRFMCLGSPQHLKNKFGQGYTLIAQLGALPDGSTAPNEPVINFIIQNFPGAKVFDDHQGYIHFQVPDNHVRLADVFCLMESTKHNLHVDDYTVHQTTLEQVFLTFTRAQTPPKEEAPHSMLKKVCCCLCLNCGCLK